MDFFQAMKGACKGCLVLLKCNDKVDPKFCGRMDVTLQGIGKFLFFPRPG